MKTPRPSARRDVAGEGRGCSDCSAPISRGNKTGRCNPCALRHRNADPAFQARRIAAIRKAYREPVKRAAAAKRIYAHHQAARRDPAMREKLNRNIWVARERLSDPDVLAKMEGRRAQAGRNRTETCLAWCPADRRDEYRYLVRSKRLPAADAKARILASLTPFERQMQAVRNGAGLVSRVIPDWNAHAR